MVLYLIFPGVRVSERVSRFGEMSCDRRLTYRSFFVVSGKRRNSGADCSFAAKSKAA
jgi:hypothetical protein